MLCVEWIGIEETDRVVGAVIDLPHHLLLRLSSRCSRTDECHDAEYDNCHAAATATESTVSSSTATAKLVVFYLVF